MVSVVELKQNKLREPERRHHAELEANVNRRRPDTLSLRQQPSGMRTAAERFDIVARSGPPYNEILAPFSSISDLRAAHDSARHLRKRQFPRHIGSRFTRPLSPRSGPSDPLCRSTSAEAVMRIDADTNAFRRLAVVYGILNRWWWALFATFLAVFLPLAAWFFFYSASVRSTGHEFVAALKRADCKEAFDLCSPALQKKLGDEKGIQQVIEKSRNLYTPSFWTSVRVRGSTARLQSTGETFGRVHAATVHLEKIDNDWRVSMFSSSGDGYDSMRVPRE